MNPVVRITKLTFRETGLSCILNEDKLTPFRQASDGESELPINLQVLSRPVFTGYELRL